jgi:hypothetical protein
MKDAFVLPSDPGPPPRHLGLAEWHRHLPAFLQIGTFVTTVVTVVVLFWILTGPPEEALRHVWAVAWASALVLGWALVYRRRLIRYPAVRGRITGFSRDSVGGAAATAVHYCYEAGRTTRRGVHLVFDARRLEVGQDIWVLVDPAHPERSIAWL